MLHQSPKHHSFWPERLPTKDLRYYLRSINITFLLLCSIIFVWFSIYQTINSILFWDRTIDVFGDNLQEISMYLSPIDRNLSYFISELDSVVQDYRAGNNIFVTKKKEVDFLVEYLRTHGAYIKQMGFDSYAPFIDFLTKLTKYKQEIFDDLGQNGVKNYLIILQNSAERRPNGWFFGSFAFVSIHYGQIEHMEIIDSYLPNFKAPDARVYGPEWMSKFLPDNSIQFIAANKLGFTDMDGQHIRDLYQKIYLTPINGVIFITSDIVKKLDPTIQKQLRERQFVNASIDIIRGENRSNKKEQYIKEVNEFFQTRKFTLAKNLIKDFTGIIADRAIQIYLPNASTGLQDFLKSEWLNNAYTPSKLYLWDTNSSNNKTDDFITKEVTITQGKAIVAQQTNNDIMDISRIQSGHYLLTIDYTLDVPADYADFIHSLEKKYNITLTRRELGILGLRTTYNYQLDERHRRSTYGLVHFPAGTSINTIAWNYYTKQIFDTPFSRGVKYFTPILSGEDKATLKIDFTLH